MTELAPLKGIKMPFLGTIINVFAIIIASVLGALLKRGLPEKVNRAIFAGISISIVFLGISGALEDTPAVPEDFIFSAGLTKFIIIIVSMVVGSAVGEIIDIDKWVHRLGAALEKKLVKNYSHEYASSNFAKGFITSTLTACVGAMSVNGAILDAVGQPDLLIAKSVIDAISCFVFASTLGIGCAFSAASVAVYQGGITLVSLLFSAFIPAATLSYLSAIGSLILVLIGTNFLGATNVKTANMTPALLMPFILVPFFNLIF